MSNFILHQWDLKSDTFLVDRNDYESNPQLFIDNNNKLYQIRTDLYPEPHIGNVSSAKVILLALNPGVKFTVDDEQFDCEELQWYAEHKTAREILKNNLKGELIDYPYYYLNPDIEAKSPGHAWFKKRTKVFFEATRLSQREFSERVACIQFFPYHSAAYKHSKKYLPTQLVNFQLVIDAMIAEKLIICMRSIRYWNSALLSVSGGSIKLSDYYNLIELKNPRQPYFTPGNIKLKEGKDQKALFDEIVARIRS